MHKQWGLTQVSVYKHVPFDHAVFIQNYFGPSMFYNQASIYMYSLVNVFCSHDFFYETAKITKTDHYHYLMRGNAVRNVNFTKSIFISLKKIDTK